MAVPRSAKEAAGAGAGLAGSGFLSSAGLAGAGAGLAGSGFLAGVAAATFAGSGFFSGAGLAGVGAGLAGSGCFSGVGAGLAGAGAAGEAGLGVFAATVTGLAGSFQPVLMSIPAMAPESFWAPASVTLVCHTKSFFRFLRSALTISSISGYWILTATSRPSPRDARCRSTPDHG